MLFLGIDLAKLTFDACLIGPNPKPIARTSLPRTKAGLDELQSFICTHAQGRPVWALMEATGELWLMPARCLDAAGFKVSVLNPKKVHHFAKSILSPHKTDALDALLIARYGKALEPRLWQPIDENRFKLRSLMRRIRQLKRMATSEKIRLKGAEVDQWEKASLERMIAMLESEQESMWSAAWELVGSDQKLKQDIELADSVPSVGPRTACQIVGELLDVERFGGAKSVACWAGLIPRHFESGTSIKRADKLVPDGCRPIRHILYMPAVSALRFNKPIRQMGQRLKDRGKGGRQRVVAAMHKLLRQVYGVLKSRQPFDPNRAFSS